MISCANDKGEIVFKPFRMCAFMWMKIPINCGMILAPPTLFWTMLVQFVSQSYNAGLNYFNKNSSCKYTNSDIMRGYMAAIASSLSIAVVMRKATAGVTKGATGFKLIFLNSLVATCSSGSANFFNSLTMRYAEIEKGIAVYSDEKLHDYLGTSQMCASSAVYQTALSRIMLSVFCLGIPTIMLYFFEKMKVIPKAKGPKLVFESCCVTFGLFAGLPLSVATFPAIGHRTSAHIEPQFKNYEIVYFSKGL